MVMTFLRETIRKQQHRIDYLGSILLILATTSFLVFVLEGGESWSWWSAPSLGLAVTSLLALSAFIHQELRTPEPLLPLSIFNSRLVVITSIATLATGVMVIGFSGNVPNFVQGVSGRTPTIAGMALAGMSIGWPLASFVAGHLMVRQGYKFTALLGTPSLVGSALWLSMLDKGSGPLEVGAATFVGGVGLGLVTTSLIVLLQNGTDPEKRGVITSANLFMWTMGSALGIAVLGALVNSHVSGVTAADSSGSVVSVDALLNEDKRAALPPGALNHLTGELSHGLHLAFMGILVAAVVTAATVALLPKGGPHEELDG
jgi:hypothetical protein